MPVCFSKVVILLGHCRWRQVANASRGHLAAVSPALWKKKTSTKKKQHSQNSCISYCSWDSQIATKKTPVFTLQTEAQCNAGGTSRLYDLNRDDWLRVWKISQNVTVRLESAGLEHIQCLTAAQSRTCGNACSRQNLNVKDTDTAMNWPRFRMRWDFGRWDQH